MHMGNLECAIVVGRNFGGIFVVWVWCVRWLLFLYVLRFLSFRHSCILGTFVGVKELKEGYYLRYVYIFRFGVGVVVV